jgi:hypothetical protein
MVLINPQITVHLPEFFSKKDEAGARAADEIESREFRLLSKPNATISLGECPGVDCMEFRFMQRVEENGEFVQLIEISGRGLGIEIPSDKQRKMRSRLIVRGAAPYANVDTGALGLSFPLKIDTQVDIMTEKYVVSLRLTDIAVDNLRMRAAYRLARASDAGEQERPGTFVISGLETSVGSPLETGGTGRP